MSIALDAMKTALLAGPEVFGGEMLFADSFRCRDGSSTHIGAGELQGVAGESCVARAVFSAGGG
jgi:hypothetical protein